MNNANFLPWVGPDYQQGINNKKIMVLGESHYCAKESDAVSTITQDVVRSVRNREERYNAYFYFERTMLGQPDVSDEEAAKLWDSLLFYNYVQEAMSTPKTSPTGAQFKDAELPFLKVLYKYHPDILIVWGEPLYRSIPQDGVQGDDLMIDGMAYQTWIYTLDKDHHVKVMWINHPSMPGFNWKHWNKGVYNFINRH